MRKTASAPQNMSNRQAKYLRNRLKALGFASYRHYLLSEIWENLKSRYRASTHLQTCYVCRDENVDLHHKTYARLGDEALGDLLPLCRYHHDQIHEEGLDLWTGAKIIRERDLDRRTKILDLRDLQRGIKSFDRPQRHLEPSLAGGAI